MAHGCRGGGALVIEAIVLTADEGLDDPCRDNRAQRPPSGGLSNTEAIGDVLYSTYLFPFEVASLILLVAMIGAIVLAKKDLSGESLR